MFRLHVVKVKMQHNLLLLFKDINALYVTNNIVLLITFMIVRMLYKSSYLTKHFQDVTKQGPLLLRRHLPASLLIHRVQTSLQIHVRIIWHLIHFCQSRLPDFSNPLKLLHHHVVIRWIVWLDWKHAVLEQQRWWYSRHSVRQCCDPLHVSPFRVPDLHLLSQLPFEERSGWTLRKKHWNHIVMFVTPTNETQ